MRTTITLNDSLAERVKRAAFERGISVSEFLQEAARAALAAKRDEENNKPFRLVTFRGDGPQPGVDLTRPSEVLDLIEQAERQSE